MPHLTPYQIGYERERKARMALESYFGCVTIRSAGSHTPVDIIAGNGQETYVVQIKSESSEDKVNWLALRYYAQMFQALPMLMVYCRGGRWKIWLDGERYLGSQDTA